MGGRILVVDDDPDVLEVLSDDLSYAGYSVLTAQSGNAALRLLEREPVDLILSDLRMPDGDGLYLLRQVRSQDPRRPAVAIITGYDEVTREELERLGAQALFTKPYHAEHLIPGLAELLPDRDQ